MNYSKRTTRINFIIIYSSMIISFREVFVYGFKQNKAIVLEAQLEATALINFYGYQGENHTATTEDGFDLTIERISSPTVNYTTKRTSKSGIPILLMHGMMCQSLQWIDNGPSSLAFLLADQGYDVWLGNLRGSYYSDHSNYNRKDKQYWDYGLEEHAALDIPAIIDYILNVTGHEKLLYVGQSLGTITAFLMLAEKPQYNEKLIAFVALGPVLLPTYIASPFNFLIKLVRNAEMIKLIESTNSIEYGETSSMLKRLTLHFCPSDNPWPCEVGVSLITGFDPYLMNKTRLPIYTSHCGTGASWKLVIHLSQLVASKLLTKYDYGPEENQLRYDSLLPPFYNASNIMVPTVLFYGANDPLANPLNIVMLNRTLPNVVAIELIQNAMATHTDYMWAYNAKELIYDKLIVHLQKLRLRN